MLICRICGRELSLINNSHLRSHNVTREEYERCFPDAEVASKELRDRAIVTGSMGFSNCRHTEESRRRMSDVQKGRNLGKTYEEIYGEKGAREIKDKQSRSFRGTIAAREPVTWSQTEEAKRKISEAVFGYRWTDEQRQRHSIAMSAFYNTEEGRQTASRNSSQPKPSEAFREAAISRWQNPEYATMMSKAFGMKPNALELELDVILREHFPGEWRYVGDGQVWLDRKNPDFINTNGKKLLIELFGDYWHTEEDVETRTQHFKQFGFDTLVIWEHDMWESEENIIQRIEEFARA